VPITASDGGTGAGSTMDLQSSSPEGIKDLIIVSQHTAAAGDPTPSSASDDHSVGVDPVDQ
jgi:hypothetical protein